MVGEAMILGKEEKIYNLVSTHDNLASQSIKYSLQKKWVFHKMINLKFRSFYEPRELYFDEILSIINREDIDISENIKIAGYRTLSTFARSDQLREEYSEKKDSIIENSQQKTDGFYRLEYYFNRAKDFFLKEQYLMAKSNFNEAYSIAKK